MDSVQPATSREGSNSSSTTDGKERNGNSPDKSVMERPKGISKEQWEQWQKRDANVLYFVLSEAVNIF